MTDDLVAMLRKDFSLDMKHEYPQTCLIEYEYERQKASDRIEKLEAALREILSLHYDHGAKAAEDIYIRDGMTFDIASKALEGKDE